MPPLRRSLLFMPGDSQRKIEKGAQLPADRVVLDLEDAVAPNPLSAYGASKLAGELLLRAAWPKHYIIRTCGLYGLAGASGKAGLRSSGNFVNTMLRLAAEGRPIRVVNDQTCTPTFTEDLAAQIALLIETEAYGTYHATNDGACTWYEFACEIFRLAG